MDTCIEESPYVITLGSYKIILKFRDVSIGKVVSPNLDVRVVLLAEIDNLEVLVGLTHDRFHSLTTVVPFSKVEVANYHADHLLLCFSVQPVSLVEGLVHFSTRHACLYLCPSVFDLFGEINFFCSQWMSIAHPSDDIVLEGLCQMLLCHVTQRPDSHQSN